MMYGFIGKAAQCLSFHAVAARISRVVVQPNAIKSLLGPEWLVVVSRMLKDKEMMSITATSLAGF